MTTRAAITMFVFALVAGMPASGQAPARAPAVPSDSVVDALTTAVASTLRCPVCQGESIQDSPAELARQMRSLVRDQLRAGKSPEEIQSYFTSKYGEWILLEPRRTGLNIVLYILPIALVLAGLVVVVALVKRWTGTPDGNTG